jgi:glucose-6-phosphate dehydrogenase assembly protein OpcA
VDSRDWHSPRTDFAMLRGLEERNPKLIVRDLNWTRFLHMRQATAKMFDHPEALAQLREIDQMRIEHGPRHRLTSYLFIGWLASQLGWALGKYTMGRNELQLRRDTSDGKPIEVSLCEVEEPVIGSLTMRAGETGASFSVELSKDRQHYTTIIALPDREPLHRVLPAGEGSAAYLVNQELVRGSRHKIFSEALEFAEPLF